MTGDHTLSFGNGPISLDLQRGQSEIAFAILNAGDVDSDVRLRPAGWHEVLSGQAAKTG
ncbi:MAG: hypothetical protein KDI45_10285 [Candidatus Accumulibacter sp.]|nr:hypothetical protein [Accumulibacter sp.]